MSEGERTRSSKKQTLDAKQLSFLKAVSDGDIEGIRTILRENLGFDVNLPRSPIDQRTALHIAARNARLDILLLLLRSGANPSVVDVDLWTPLHLSCYSGVRDETQSLLHAGAPVDAKDRDHMTALHLASFKGNSDMVRLLTVFGCTVNVRNIHNWTPLHLAASSGSIACVRMLIDSGADINASKLPQGTALHIAVHQSNAEMAKELLARGADQNILDGKGRKASEITKFVIGSEMYRVFSSAASSSPVASRAPKQEPATPKQVAFGAPQISLRTPSPNRLLGQARQTFSSQHQPLSTIKPLDPVPAVPPKPKSAWVPIERDGRNRSSSEASAPRAKMVIGRNFHPPPQYAAPLPPAPSKLNAAPSVPSTPSSITSPRQGGPSDIPSIPVITKDLPPVPVSPSPKELSPVTKTLPPVPTSPKELPPAPKFFRDPLPPATPAPVLKKELPEVPSTTEINTSSSSSSQPLQQQTTSDPLDDEFFDNKHASKISFDSVKSSAVTKLTNDLNSKGCERKTVRSQINNLLQSLEDATETDAPANNFPTLHRLASEVSDWKTLLLSLSVADSPSPRQTDQSPRSAADSKKTQEKKADEEEEDSEVGYSTMVVREPTDSEKVDSFKLSTEIKAKDPSAPRNARDALQSFISTIQTKPVDLAPSLSESESEESGEESDEESDESDDDDDDDRETMLMKKQFTEYKEMIGWLEASLNAKNERQSVKLYVAVQQRQMQQPLKEITAIDKEEVDTLRLKLRRLTRQCEREYGSVLPCLAVDSDDDLMLSDEDEDEDDFEDEDEFDSWSSLSRMK